MITIQITIFILYTTLIVYRYGILPSISESWYVLPLRQKFLFTLFTWGIGIPMLFYDSGALFLSGSALTFVGVATQFKTSISFTREVHYAGALIGVLVPLIYFGISSDNWIPLVIQVFATMFIVLTKTQNKIWWTEIVAFVCVLIGLLNI
jgi:hypothetical protein